MSTITTSTTCGQVSDTLNTFTTINNVRSPHLTDVDIGMVGQSLAHEGDIRNSLRVDLHQRPEETQQRHNSHH
ncbi:hypothetical protein GBAR_LOCUS27749 [Geodia barretti]|uniref:Uncharacterized protein n=1 Tax=Geodia barretti TaxID=519541 RepID=A0AA35XH27_GEOBA|nr:hypothetical protein GBAR_LOCUS27749 [Geodia barretti]